jgi:adenosylmethionine-8-amino-7-oxononanoate aminotransferase
MVALDLVKDKMTREPIHLATYANAVAEMSRALGVLSRPVRTTIILSPPLVIDTQRLDAIAAALRNWLR